MKKPLTVIICAASLILWGVGLASAGNVTWKILEHSSIAGKGPGADGLVGKLPDTTDNCNFAPLSSSRAACTSGTKPSVGSYSINRINFSRTEECIALSVISGGSPCKCNDNTTNCDPGPNQDDICPDIQGGCGESPGKCCATGFTCQACEDANSYFGSGGVGSNTGTMGTCTDSSQIKTTSFDVATTPSLPIGGGGCIKLGLAGSQPNRATPCTNNNPISGYLDANVWVGGCSGDPAFTVPDVPYTGYIFPVTSVPASGACDYSQAELATIRDNAVAVSGNQAKYIMVVCGVTPIPASIPQLPCFPGASVEFIEVAWTSDEISCTGTCP